jgi:hypothetical protein
MSDELIKGLRLGSPSNPLIMSLIEYEGHRLLDIRKYFIDKKSKETKPTRKGVSLNAKLARQVQDAITENAKPIFEWLECGDNSALTEVERSMMARTKAMEEESLKPRTFRVKNREWKGAECFAFESNGGEDHVALNTKHPFYEKLNCSRGEDANTCSPIILMLAAYYHAKLRFSGEIESDAEHFFKLFEHEWGLLLKNYCQNDEAINHD